MNSDAPERIKNWRGGFFSIARYYGAININGHRYEVCPVTDDLARADVLAMERKDERHKAAERRKWESLKQTDLFD